MSQHKIVRIAHGTEKTTLSKAQKKFNSLTNKIEMQKKLLQEWQDSVQKYNHREGTEYKQLLDNFNNHRVELVHLLDNAYGNKLFKKADKEKIKYLIEEITFLLIQDGKEEMKSLYEKYSNSDYDKENEESNIILGDIFKNMFQEMFNVEFTDDLDTSSPEKMAKALKQKLQEKQNQYDEKRSKRKKTAKQLAKEEQQKQEELNASKSIQDIFRKLTTAFHPDREQDEVERERKTKIMQKVNVAYNKKDLLQLLALQLEFEQIDQTQLNTIAEGRLKHFNKILQEQLDELQQEIYQIEHIFKIKLDIPPFLNLTPNKLLEIIEEEISNMQLSITNIKKDLELIQDPAALKAWLKSYKIKKSP